MYQAVTAPEVQPIRAGRLRRWDYAENNAEIGLGQMIERLQLETVPVIASPSIVPDHEDQAGGSVAHVCFERWLVKEGESVWHGKPLAEVIIHGTHVQVISLLDGFVVGLVDWQEGDLLESGQVIANIATRFDQGSKKTGLNPKPSSAMYFARTGHFRVF